MTYIVMTHRNGHGYYHNVYPWSHTGNELRLGWSPSDGDKIRLCVVPLVPAYKDNNADVFGNSRNVERHLANIVSEAFKAYLCMAIASRKLAANKPDESQLWEAKSKRIAFDVDGEGNNNSLIKKAEYAIGKEKHGTNPGRIQRTFP